MRQRCWKTRRWHALGWPVALAAAAVATARRSWAAAFAAGAAVRIGHDGSDEAASFLESLEARRLRGTAQLLSPPGEPSERPPGEEGLGRVWALLPGRKLRCLEDAKWALEPPSIGTLYEWETWSYLQTLLGNRWWDAYAFEYWRFLRPSVARAELLAEARAKLEAASKDELWWHQASNSADVVSMLRNHGFCVLDNFLPESLAKAIADSAEKAYEGNQMGSGVLSSGGGFARGDAVLWVNTHDPAAGGKENMAPKEGQSSAAIAELRPVLEHIDTLVGDVLAPEFPDRMQCVRTRSHAMFTCYPATDTELLDTDGQAWLGPVTDEVGGQGSRGYLRHLDNVRAQGHCGRILTTIMYLNEGWEENLGGAIRLFEVNPPLDVRAEVLPKANRLLCFWSDEIPHEVLPPRRDRFACTFWYLDREEDPSSVAFAKAPAAKAQMSSGSLFLD